MKNVNETMGIIRSSQFYIDPHINNLIYSHVFIKSNMAMLTQRIKNNSILFKYNALQQYKDNL